MPIAEEAGDHLKVDFPDEVTGIGEWIGCVSHVLMMRNKCYWRAELESIGRRVISKCRTDHYISVFVVAFRLAENLFHSSSDVIADAGQLLLRQIRQESRMCNGISDRLVFLRVT